MYNGRAGLGRSGRGLLILLLGWGWGQPVLAQEGDEVPTKQYTFDELLSRGAVDRSSPVAKVLVKGNRKTEAEVVRGVIQSRAGLPFDDRIVSEDIRRIYLLSHFDDIQVDLSQTPEGLVLTFLLQEKPAIREVKYEGLDELGEDDLKDVINLRPFAMLDINEVSRNAQKIKDLYAEKGYLRADVKYRLARASTTEVDVIFEIVEHAKVQVERITFLGNRAISSEELKANIATRELTWHSFVSSSGTFKSEVLEIDRHRIQAHYMNRGYVNVKIADPEVTLGSDLEHIHVNIRIQEGEQFRLGKIELSGDLLDAEPVLRRRLTMKSGEVFDRSRLFADMERIQNWFKDKGYAYANVNPLSNSDDKQRIIDLDLRVEKGNLVRIGRVSMVNNEKTRDKVIRRELRVYEGELYSETGLQLSKRNVTRLGFFETVEITTKRGEQPDTMDLQVEVKERQTGTFQVGFGLSSMESIIGTAQVSQTNMLGRGQNLSLQATLSSIRQYVNLHFGEPHFLDTNWIFGFDLFKYQYEYSGITQGSSGASLTLGYQLTDDLQISFTYKLADTNFHYRSLHQSGLTSSVKGAISYDTRDDRWLPTRGLWASLSNEVAYHWIGSEHDFNSTIFNVRYYHPLVWKVIGMARLEYGNVRSLSGRPVPEFEKFHLGGINDVRGFARWGICIPEDRVSSDDSMGRAVEECYGGTEEVVINLELTFPLFEAVGIRGVVFNDFGQVYKRNGTILNDPTALWKGLRATWGLGFRWFSPIGPLRFEWGFPYNPLPGEDDYLFEFTIGNF